MTNKFDSNKILSSSTKLAKISPIKRVISEEITNFKDEISKLHSLNTPNEYFVKELEEKKENKLSRSELLTRHELLKIFRPIINQEELFNPEIELQRIKSLALKSKKKELQKWKNKLKAQFDLLASIPEKIRILAEEHDYNDKYLMNILNDIIKTSKINFKDLSKEQRRGVLLKTYSYVKSKYFITQFLNKEEYKNNHKKLLSDILGMDDSILKGEITREIYGANLIFYIENKADYKIIHQIGENDNGKSDYSRGFSTNISKIEELKGSLSCINGGKVYKGEKYSDLNYINKLANFIYKRNHKKRILGTIIHETSHRNNRIIRTEKKYNDSVVTIKDEIIAYISEGENVEEFGKYFFYTGEQGLYDYFEEEKINLTRYRKLRDLHEKEVYIALRIAHMMQLAKIPNYIDLLTIVPVRQWNLLEEIYLESGVTKRKLSIKEFLKKLFKKA